MTGVTIGIGLSRPQAPDTVSDGLSLPTTRLRGCAGIDAGTGRGPYMNMSRGRIAVTSMLGTSTVWAMRRSTAALHSA